MLQIKRSELRELAQNKLGDDSIESQNKILVKISVAMAARTSYTVVGDEKEIDYERMIELHDRLVSQNPPHSSPLEHCARAMSDEEYFLFRRGKGEANYNLGISSSNPVVIHSKEGLGWCRNYKGFIQYRHIVE